ncbi:MAG: NAD-binding protein, partial [Phycisphaerales bacterium]|nr:NAD-binding protein [Phycisphaerales bacterium]
IAPFAPRAFHLGHAGLAAAAKLVINGLYAGQVAMLAECTAFLKASGVRDSSWLELLGVAPTIAPPVAAAGRAIGSGTHAPMFPIELVNKDLAYLIDAMKAKRVRGALPEAVGKRFSEAVSAELGDKNITAVALHDKPRTPDA